MPMTNAPFRIAALLGGAVLALLLLPSCSQKSAGDLVASAKQRIAAKEYPLAIIDLKNAIQISNNREAQYLLGKALLETGNFRAAEVHLRHAQGLKHPAEDVAPDLATAMAANGDYRQVAAQFATVTLADPQRNALLKVLVGEAYLATGSAEAAESAFREALQANPKNLRAEVGVARVLTAQGETTKALTRVEAILSSQPGQPDAAMLKADLLMAQNKPAEARQLYAELAKADPHNINPRIRLVSLALADGDVATASREIAAMKAAMPNDLRWKYFEAMLAFRKSEFTKARDLVAGVLKAAPDHPPALLLAGATEYALGNYSTAESELRKVLTAFPGNLYARNLLVAAYLRRGQPAKAEEALAPALKSSPDDPTILRAAGEVAFANNRIADAAKYYEQAIAREKAVPSAAAHQRLAQIRMAAGETARALSELEIASGLDKSQFQADLSLMAAHLQRKDYAKALGAVAQIEAKRPNDPMPPSLRGAVLAAKGDTAGARASLEKSLSLQPDYLPAARLLSRLDVVDKKPAAAKDRLNAIIAKAPANDGAILSLAETQSLLREPPRDIAATIERAITANPASSAPRIALIRHHSQQRDAHAALNAASAAVAAIPGDVYLLDHLGLAQLAAGDPAQAIATFKKLSAAWPDSPLPLVRLASAQFAAKQVNEPIESLNQALKLRPDFIDAKRDIISVQIASGRIDEAMRASRALQRAEPKAAAGFALEGDALAAQKKFGEAARAYGEGTRRQGDPVLVVKQHEALVAAGKAGEAEALAGRWMKDNPTEPVLRFHLATAAMQRNDMKTAARLFKDLLTIRPNDPSLLNNLAWSLNELKDPEAVAVAEHAHRAAPGSAEIADTYGWVLLANGQTARALEVLDAASKAHPGQPDLRLHLAQALIKGGDRARARKELEAVIAMPGARGQAAEAKAILAGL